MRIAKCPAGRCDRAGCAECWLGIGSTSIAAMVADVRAVTRKLASVFGRLGLVSYNWQQVRVDGEQE